MLLEELFQEGFSKLNLFKGDMKKRRFKEPEPKREHPHLDDPEREAWHKAGGNLPGYDGTNRADNLAKIQVGFDAWNNMSPEEQTAAAQAAAKNANSSVDLTVKSAEERIADQARQAEMTQAEIEAEKIETNKRFWQEKNAALAAKQAKLEAELEAERKKKEAEREKLDKELAAAHGN